MKKLILGATLALTMATAAAPSYATFGHGKECNYKFSWFCKFKPNKPYKPSKPNKPNKPSTPVQEVPEIDAAGAALALALMGGIVAVRRERRNLKK